MKWIALALIILSAPTLAAWLRTNPRGAWLAWGSLSFLPFVIGPWHLSVAPFATPVWSGYVKGWEVSFIDAVAFGVVFGTKGRWPKISLMLPFAAYFLAVLLAVFQARFFNLALSYPIQLARVGLVLLAVARVCTFERGERAVFGGLVLGICVQAAYALWARAGGALQTGGSLGHQNLLGFLSHMVLMPAFAVMLSGRWQKTAGIGVLAALTAVILTASRATIIFAGIGLVLTLLLSLGLRFTGRKAGAAFISLILLGVSAPLAYSALQRRLDSQNISLLTEDNERAAFERAARAMISAKPMGVGPNHYNFIANTEGYSERAGVNWSFGNRTANVHNSYLLVGAETGYLGLATMAGMLASAILLALSTAFRFRRDPSVEILIGVGVGLFAVCLHGFYEWMFVVYPTQYVMACSLGLLVGIRSRLTRASAAQKGSPLLARDRRRVAVLAG